MKKYLILAATVLVVCGCSEETDVLKNNGRTSLQVTGGISVVSRAINNKWDANDAIGIFMIAAGTQNILEDASNRRYITTSGDGNFVPSEPGQTIYFPIDGSSGDFIAYYPYQALGNEGKWKVSLAEQSGAVRQESIDLLSAGLFSSENGKYNKDNSSIRLPFVHRLSKLVLNITNGTGLTLDDLKNMKVEITGQRTEVIYEPLSDVLDAEVTSRAITLKISADGTLAEGILYPAVADPSPIEGRQLVFTLADSQGVFRWDIPSGKSFEAGMKTIYDITIDRTGLNVGSSITDWVVDEEGSHSGSAE